MSANKTKKNAKRNNRVNNSENIIEGKQRYSKPEKKSHEDGELFI